MTTPAHQVDALAALEQLVNQLRIAADPAITLAWQPIAVIVPAGAAATDSVIAQAAVQQVGHLIIKAPSGSSFATLTTAMPALPEWSLFYTFLRQLQPTIETRTGWLDQTTTLRLSLDLQSVATGWQRVATNLDAQATQLETGAAGRNARDAAEAEQALRARIQAANYRTSAQEWRKLTRDSWVLIQLAIPAGLQDPVRTWLVTPESPAQMAELRSSPSYVTAFISVLVLGMGFLLLVSGLLWWLL